MNFYYMVSETFELNVRARVIAMCSMCCFVTCIVPLYFILEAIWAIMRLELENYNKWIAIVFAVLEIFVVFGFIYYGICLGLALNRFSGLLPEQRARIKKVTFVATACSLCFALRAVLTFVSIANDQEFFSKGYFFHTSWFVLLVYFLAFEIFPSILIIYLLGNLPQWKVSDYYETERASLLYDRHEMRESQISDPSTWR